MTHPRERLSAYLDGELPAGEATGIEEHLQDCTECSRELAILGRLRGAMRTMTGTAGRHTVWDDVHRRITRPAGWLFLMLGAGIWAVLALLAWWRAELTLEWVAGTGVAAGLILLLIGMGHEQYRDWKDTRYKDVER
ncbi:MAG TPA: zf-HC2 domain-containing protein [Longimicrobiales bacterium]|nr:zf-HC2 domain-containing protein [Longimicrobiales bacterium]